MGTPRLGVAFGQAYAMHVWLSSIVVNGKDLDRRDADAPAKRWYCN
jgi:hypothetical protein